MGVDQKGAHWKFVPDDFMIQADCRYFVGEKPCRFKRLCAGCDHYSPMGTRVLIIKFGAMGDALRTTPILHGLRRIYQLLHITWITDEISFPLLDGNPYIDRLWIFKPEVLARLSVEQFDLVLNFDKVPEALSIAEMAKATLKKGFRMSPYGTLSVFNDNSRYALLLGVSDPVKFYKNQLTYPETIFEMAEIDYNRTTDEYVLSLSPEVQLGADTFLKELGINSNDSIIGLNTGCGPVFATKKWTQEGFIALAERLVAELPVKIVLLGGKAERERNKMIEAALHGKVINTGNEHSIKQFTGLINRCDLIVTGDTVAMHIAIALRKYVVGIFGPTCAQEIDFYGRGEKIVTDFPCAPCYLKVSPMKPTCMEALSHETVYAAVLKCLKEGNLLSAKKTL